MSRALISHLRPINRSNPMRADVEALSADIEQSIALLRRRL